MLVVLIVLIVVLGLLAGEAMFLRHRSPLNGELVEPALEDTDGWLAQVSGRRVTVHLIGDQTLEGVMVDVSPDGLILRAAQLVLDVKHDMAGDVFVPSAKVLLVQQHPVEP